MKKSYISLKERRVLRNIAFVCLADGLVGLSYGAVSVSSGIELWVPLTLSILVLAGASEFLFIGIVASGGSAVSAAFAGLLVNARHLPFGLAVKDCVGNGISALLGCHIMNDESVVFGLNQPSYYEQKLSYWLCGVGILIVWPLGVFLGGTLGSLITDTSALGLDAMFPAIIFALVLPNIKSVTNVISAASGSIIAVAAVPFLPIGLPALLSLTGVYIGRKVS
ncbi:AzlC family ABC transporter permease [Vibrio salinus]|uniref:AzlC family ABC transporter permease n=1 Tax=Vibrio salinus TaxID=2899784 RepID=UPI001E335B6D|nr:AzlC family ABC transporter permease [Vibrio salinus]MCE0495845.1 AzlC family ABC transporter permease [Vibrio salinus]